MICAKGLADAEAWAEESEFAVVWEREDNPDVSWMDERAIEEFKSERLLMLYAWLTTQEEADAYKRDASTYQSVFATLGGICVSGTDQPCCRVIAAELADEARHNEAQIPEGWAL